MLSIQLNADKEWWVSGNIFDRLFQSALSEGIMPPNLEYWLHVADANGGLNLSIIEPAVANDLVTALRYTAEHEVTRLANAALTSEDGSYRISLLKLLEVTDEQPTKTKIRGTVG